MWQHKNHHHIRSNKSSNEFTIERYTEDKPSIQPGTLYRWGNWFAYQETHVVVPLITFSGNFATFFGNNFLFLQCFLIRKLLLDEVILPSTKFSEPRNTELKCQNRGSTELFLKKTGGFSIKKLNILPLPRWKSRPSVEKFKILQRFLTN